MNEYKKVVFALLLPILMLTVGIPVLANNNSSNTNTVQSEVTKREAVKQAAEAKREVAKQEFEQKREAAKNELEQHKEKLKDNRLKICQEREDHINSSMTNAVSRGQAKLDLFSKIAERTEAFYVLKGQVLAGYNDLIVTLNNEKAAAQSAVDSVKASSDDFKCGGDNPKGIANLFKIDLQSMNDALKNYRTAVKSLIVGVKSVQSTTEPEGNH